MTGKSDSSFGVMKSQVAAGIGAAGSFAYENMNFGLCRILLSTILGTIATTATFMVDGFDLNDGAWDAVTINTYTSYVKSAVFAPAGVSGPTLDHQASDALAYTFPVADRGWNSGNLETMAGGAAWHMSIDDLSKVLSSVRRGGTIMAAARAEAMVADQFGFEANPTETPLGLLHWKGGYWGGSKGHIEQTLIYFLPRDMELALLTNSPVSSPEQKFPDVVSNAYTANIQPAISLRDFLIRHGLPIASSVHPLTGPARSLRTMLPT